MGKGDWRRPSQVPDQRYAESWCLSFGHRRIDFERERCLDCGVSKETAIERGEAWGAQRDQAAG